MFESFANTPVLVFLLGMAIVAPLLLWQAGRTARLRRENSSLSAEFEQVREILAAAPDGLFIWDHRRGSEKCSRRLAVLLGLEEGTQSQFTHVLARFDANAAANLKAAVRALHRHGTSFELVLDLKDRQFQITGGRAVALDGRVLNDLMWVRELSEAATEPPHKDQADQAAFDHFTLMLDSLPLAVWIRDRQQSVVFANQAARNLGLLEGSSEPIEFADGLAVSEIPARGWAGTIGFAIDPPPQAAPVQDRLEPSVLDHLATAIAIFDRETILSFANLSFATLWGLDSHWLATAPALGEILDHLRSNRRLPEVTDFKAFRDQQLALFAHLPEPESTLLHLPDGRAIQRFVAPYIDGGLFFSFEDQSGRLDLERSFNALDAVQRETLDHLYEGVAVFGSDGRLKLCNPAFAKIWDLSAAFLDRAPHISDFIDTTRPLIAG
ncbi:MAG TPA: PAS domain-containing protein, partial [Rhodospirillales bacterium]|nr:PAS domain-containing protein [Rhodospirillales bacterium]